MDEPRVVYFEADDIEEDKSEDSEDDSDVDDSEDQRVLLYDSTLQDNQEYQHAQEHDIDALSQSIMESMVRLKIVQPKLKDISMELVVQFWDDCGDDLEFVLEVENPISLAMMNEFCTTFRTRPLRGKYTVDDCDPDYPPCIPAAGRVSCVVFMAAQSPVIAGIMTERYDFNAPNRTTDVELPEPHVLESMNRGKRIHWLDLSETAKRTRTSEEGDSANTSAPAEDTAIVPLTAEFAPAPGNAQWITSTNKDDIVIYIDREEETGRLAEVKFEFALHSLHMRLALQKELSKSRATM